MISLRWIFSYHFRELVNEERVHFILDRVTLPHITRQRRPAGTNHVCTHTISQIDSHPTLSLSNHPSPRGKLFPSIYPIPVSRTYSSNQHRQLLPISLNERPWLKYDDYACSLRVLWESNCGALPLFTVKKAYDS